MTKILLVDDDPLLASVRKSLLERRFSDVHRVADAAEALCLVEEPSFALNLGLVVTGHHMPGIGGPEFVAELHSRMPALPVLVLGDATEVSADYAGDRVHFLQKPVDTEKMLATATQMLAQNERDSH